MNEETNETPQTTPEPAAPEQTPVDRWKRQATKANRNREREYQRHLKRRQRGSW